MQDVITTVVYFDIPLSGSNLNVHPPVFLRAYGYGFLSAQS
jgi:hypothetical protein